MRLGPGSALFSIALLMGCATAYQSKGASGGFAETRLGEDLYQVRFQGNGYTSQGKASEFLLRRCAELTLEHGKRWFLVGDMDRQTSSSMGAGLMFSFPQGQATLRMLDGKSDPMAVDAVTVIEETNAAAEGRLSPAARKTLTEFRNADPGG